MLNGANLSPDKQFLRMGKAGTSILTKNILHKALQATGPDELKAGAAPANPNFLFEDSNYQGYRTSSVTAKDNEPLPQQFNISKPSNANNSAVQVKQEEIESSYGLTNGILKPIGTSPS